jgi:hypothetical protein
LRRIIHYHSYLVNLLPNNIEPLGGNGFGFGDFNYQSSIFSAKNTNPKKLFEEFAVQLPSSWQRLSVAESETGITAVYQYTDAKQSGIAILSINDVKERPDAYIARLTAFPQL